MEMVVVGTCKYMEEEVMVVEGTYIHKEAAEMRTCIVVVHSSWVVVETCKNKGYAAIYKAVVEICKCTVDVVT